VTTNTNIHTAPKGHSSIEHTESFQPKKTLSSHLLDAETDNYKQLFYRNPLPSWIYDIENMRFLEVNEAAIQHYGYSKEEFLELSLFDIRPLEDRESFSLLFEQAKLQSINRHRKLRHLTKKGKVIYVDVYTNDLMYTGKKCRLVVINDVTEIIETQKELKESNERFELVAEATSDAIYDWNLASNTLNWGIGLTNLFGYLSEEVSISNWEELIHPDDRKRISNDLDKAIQSEETKHWKGEYRFKRKDGSYSYVLEKGFIVRNAEGRAIRMIGAVQDITELKEKEQELLRTKERFELAVKATSDIVWDWDFTTNRVVWPENYSLILGWELPVDKVQPSEYCLERFHPEDKENIIQSLQATLSDTSTVIWNYEFRYQRSDGTYAHVSNRAYIIRNDEGKAIRMIGAMEDITERKKLEAELLEKELDKQKQISQATIDTQEKERGEIGKELHDNVNQVLTTTKLYLDLSQTNPELKDDLIHKSSKNIIYVINEIRQLSRSLMNPSLGDLGLIDSLNDLIENINATRKLNVVLETKSFSETSINTHKSLMVFRIIQEALNNAIKHARAKSVLIRISTQKNTLHLQIKDDGVGFEQHKIKKGAGLNNIQNRVYLSNGLLSLETAPGNGCTINIKIPV
jgi:PAS domain S-box-containing protein